MKVYDIEKQFSFFFFILHKLLKEIFGSAKAANSMQNMLYKWPSSINYEKRRDMMLNGNQ